MIKPQKLQPGDKVATVSLSWGGPGTIPHRYEAGKKQLQDEFGLVVVEMPHTLSDADWLHRNPQARADDLMAAFADPTIKGIISTIGGDDFDPHPAISRPGRDLLQSKSVYGIFRHHHHASGLSQGRVGHILWAGNHGWIW